LRVEQEQVLKSMQAAVVAVVELVVCVARLPQQAAAELLKPHYQ
jgi:hypothetical protein